MCYWVTTVKVTCVQCVTTIARITYTVLVVTLNHAKSINQCVTDWRQSVSHLFNVVLSDDSHCHTCSMMTVNVTPVQCGTEWRQSLLQTISSSHAELQTRHSAVSPVTHTAPLDDWSHWMCACLSRSLISHRAVKTASSDEKTYVLTTTNHLHTAKNDTFSDMSEFTAARNNLPVILDWIDPRQHSIQGSHFHWKNPGLVLTFQDHVRNFPGPFRSPGMLKYKEKTTFTHNIQGRRRLLKSGPAM